MAKGVKFFLGTLTVLFLVVAAGVGGLVYMLYRQDGGTEVRDVIIPRGASLGAVSRILVQNEIVRQPDLFKLLLRVTKGDAKVRAGEFRFKKEMRMIDALFVLYNDEPIVHQVTIPEGWNARQIAAAFAQASLVDEKKFLRLVLTKAAADKFHIKAPTLEGFLFPDTYAFSKVDGEERIVESLVHALTKRWESSYKAEAAATGMTFEQIVTLASIVEKETGGKAERAVVASVFHNRLKKRMPLQSDPTTIYGIPNFNGNLTRDDLHRYSPYNTYTIPALPPGPIASPGDAAIRATMHPATTNYLYFVSNNQGQHIFSETYEKHARQVTTWQKEYFHNKQRLGKNGKKN